MRDFITKLTTEKFLELRLHFKPIIVLSIQNFHCDVLIVNWEMLTKHSERRNVRLLSRTFVDCVCIFSTLESQEGEGKDTKKALFCYVLF